jgi:hypothetical protein
MGNQQSVPIVTTALLSQQVTNAMTPEERNEEARDLAAICQRRFLIHNRLEPLAPDTIDLAVQTERKPQGVTWQAIWNICKKTGSWCQWLWDFVKDCVSKAYDFILKSITRLTDEQRTRLIEFILEVFRTCFGHPDIHRA